MSRGECPNPRPDCPYSERPQGCFSDIHHFYFPKNHYRDILSAEFRELPENKERICRNEHDEKHATGAIPEKPTRQVMLYTVAEAITRGERNINRKKLGRIGLTNEVICQMSSGKDRT